MCSKCECCGLLCAVFRIGCYRCCRKIQGKEPEAPRPEYSVLMLGLSEAGKSFMLAKLGSEPTDGIEPTQGFSVKPVQLPNAILNVKELGGGDNVRKYWQHYFGGAQGVIFVVDSTNSEEDLEFASSELQTALSHPSLGDLPLLVLANKQDKEGAKPAEQITQIFNLDALARNREWKVEGCSWDTIDSTRDLLSTFVYRIAGEEEKTEQENRL